VADINKRKTKSLKKRFKKIRIVAPSIIHRQKVDIFSPCSLGGCLSSKALPQLRAKIIVGGANCQLTNRQIGQQLHHQGILYAPDYVVNAGGLISVVDEYENRRLNKRRIQEKVLRIKNTLRTVIAKSKKQKKPTSLVADQMAREIIKKIKKSR
jgi:leucine dehydrogenase